MDRNKNKSYFSVLFKQYKYYVYAIAMIFLAIYLLPIVLSSDLGLFGVYAGDANQVRGTSFNTNTLAGLRDFLFFLTPFIFFRHLYSKTEMDTYFSMPISRTSLFFKHLAFNYIVVVAPMLISYVIGFIAVVTGGNVIDMSAIMVGFLLKGVSLAVSGVIILAISVLAITLTTTMFNGLIYAGVINLIPLVGQLLYRSFENNFYGYTQSAPQATRNEFIDNLNHLIVTQDDIYDITSTDKTLAVFVWFGIALALIALATHLYRNRKVYRIEGEYMVKGFYSTIISIFMVMVLVLVFLAEYEYYLQNGIILAMSNRQNETILIFLAFLVGYYIVQMVRLHGRPNFIKTLLGYILLFAVSLGLTQVLYTELIYKNAIAVPELADVETVVVTNDRDFSYEYGEERRREERFFDPETQRYFVNNGGVSKIFEEYEIVDKPVIAELITFHEEMIDTFYLVDLSAEDIVGDPLTDYYYSDIAYIKLTYLDVNGDEILSREFRVYELQFGEWLSEILSEDIYYESGIRG